MFALQAQVRSRDDFEAMRYVVAVGTMIGNRDCVELEQM